MYSRYAEVWLEQLASHDIREFIIDEYDELLAATPTGLGYLHVRH